MANLGVSRFLELVQAREGQGYIYGAYFRDIITEAYIQAKARQFPDQYTASYIERSRRWIGQYAGDCNGLIKQALWTRPDGQIEYQYLGRPDMSANSMYEAAAILTETGVIGTLPEAPGTLLFAVGSNGNAYHVGVYLGGGYAMESRGVDYGVVKTLVASREWTHWGYSVYIDYTDPVPVEDTPETSPGVYYSTNTIDEGLELGPLMRNSTIVETGLAAMDIVVATTHDSSFAPVSGAMSDGIYQGVAYYGSQSATAISDFLDNFVDAAKKDAIVCVFMCPHVISNAPATTVAPVYNAANNTLHPVKAPPQPASLDGYVPRNKKLLMYPFQFLYVHNKSGQAAVYRYEHFTGTPTFQFYGPIMPGLTVKLRPSNKGAVDTFGLDDDDALTISGFPLCSWNSEVYRAWLAGHKASLATNLAGSGLSLAGSAISGSGQALASGILSITSQLAAISEMQLQPTQCNGQVGSGDANIVGGGNDFQIYCKSIRREYAERLDKFFDMFGYKQGRVKVPNLSGRPCWNYVKTVDANIIGDIPAEDMAKLRAIFDNGVTIWATGSGLGDYGQNNH